MPKRSRKLGVTAWASIASVALMVLLALASRDASAADISLKVAHWSHHWTSDSITNERHKFVAIRVDNVFIGRAYNSYRQPGFDGETWFAGVTKEWTWAENVTRWGGDILARGYLGASYGYTKLAGHDPDKDPGLHPMIAGELVYQQPFDKHRYQHHTHYWEAGVLQFGDASLPGLGIGTKF